MAPLGYHLGTLGHHFGEPGIPGDTQLDTLGPDLDFYRFWEDFGTLLGPSLASVWLIFRVLGHQIGGIGSRLVFLVIWVWKSHQDPMLGCA